MARAAVALGLALALTPLAGCSVADFVAQRAAIAKADFQFDHAQLVHADVPFLTPDAKADFNVVLKVTNPNPITARLDSLDYTFLLGGSAVGTGRTSQDFSVEAGATKQLVLPISVPYAGLPQPALQAIQQRSAQMTVRGTTHLSTPFGKLDYPVEVSKTESF